MFGLLPLFTLAAFCASSVNGHGLILAATGTNGVSGKGFAVVDGTPRDTGRGVKSVEGDTSVIRDKEIASGKVGGCGRTGFGGATNVAAQLAASSAAGLPTIGADGVVKMTIHQVNGDGAGPYTCEVSADGTANTFAAMTVTQNVPGTNSRSKNKATDFQVLAVMPAGTACTGGPNGDACVVRCRNGANAGPFGGCVAVAQAGTAAAGNATAVAATGAAAAGNGVAAAVAPAAAAGTVAAGSAAAGTAAAGTAAAGTVADTAGAAAAASPAAAETALTAATAAGVAAAAASPAAVASPATGAGAVTAEGTAAQAAPASVAGAAVAGGVAAAATNNVAAAAKKVTKRYISSRILGARRLSAWL